MSLMGLSSPVTNNSQMPEPRPVTAATSIADLHEAYQEAHRELEALKRDHRRVARKLRAEKQLRPWQVELLKLQKHLECHRMRMIVLFEGRDAAGKGGTIRRA